MTRQPALAPGDRVRDRQTHRSGTITLVFGDYVVVLFDDQVEQQLPRRRLERIAA
jgi:hypothetical protein